MHPSERKDTSFVTEFSGWIFFCLSQQVFGTFGQGIVANRFIVAQQFFQLDMFIIQNEDEFDGEIRKCQEILIHGDPEGLKSLATLLIKLADTNQNDNVDLPVGAREHIHLRLGHGLSKSSERVIIGRLGAKGTGAFYDRYVPAEK